VQEDLPTFTDVIGHYLNTAVRFRGISSGSSKLFSCKHFFIAVTALYFGFLCRMFHSSLSTLCTFYADFIPACRSTFSVTSNDFT
jgi:hypothetical protein